MPRKAGAIVRREKRQGKGFVVAAMFDQIEEDILVMVDGDDTYDAAFVHQLIEPILRGDADMTAATRLTEHEEKSFRPLHTAGNHLVSKIINWMFNAQIGDIFSGYRVFTRAAVRQIPITARGFDVETELTLQALYRGLIIKELPSAYRTRPEGSFSKLNTFSDGFRVLLRLFLILEILQAADVFRRRQPFAVRAGAAGRARPVCEYIVERYVYTVPQRHPGGRADAPGVFLARVGIDFEQHQPALAGA